MARGYRRRLDEAAQRLHQGRIEGNLEIPIELQHLAGPFGPWVKDDKIEFHHLCKEAQELWVRMSPADVLDMQGAVADFVRRRTIRKWLTRIFWAVTTGFGAVYAAGEKLLHFLHWLGGIGLDPSLIWQALRGLISS
jgi:hypothetical protein